MSKLSNPACSAASVHMLDLWMLPGLRVTAGVSDEADLQVPSTSLLTLDPLTCCHIMQRAKEYMLGAPSRKHIPEYTKLALQSPANFASGNSSKPSIRCNQASAYRIHPAGAPGQTKVAAQAVPCRRMADGLGAALAACTEAH